jgi:hypothetical protein
MGGGAFGLFAPLFASFISSLFFHYQKPGKEVYRDMKDYGRLKEK